MKTKKQLLANYDKIVNDITNRVSSVNRGGCGVYAYMLGQELRKRKIDFEYVILFRGELDKYDIEEIENGINDNDVRSVNEYHWTHIMIKLSKKKFIDGEGVYQKAIMNGSVLKYKEITETFLDSMLKAKHIWNPTFDRTKCKPKIKNIFKKHLVD